MPSRGESQSASTHTRDMRTFWLSTPSLWTSIDLPYTITIKVKKVTSAKEYACPARTSEPGPRTRDQIDCPPLESPPDSTHASTADPANRVNDTPEDEDFMPRECDTLFPPAFTQRYFIRDGPHGPQILNDKRICPTTLHFYLRRYLRR